MKVYVVIDLSNPFEFLSKSTHVFKNEKDASVFIDKTFTTSEYVMFEKEVIE